MPGASRPPGEIIPGQPSRGTVVCDLSNKAKNGLLSRGTRLAAPGGPGMPCAISLKPHRQELVMYLHFRSSVGSSECSVTGGHVAACSIPLAGNTVDLGSSGDGLCEPRE